MEKISRKKQEAWYCLLYSCLERNKWSTWWWPRKRAETCCCS